MEYSSDNDYGLLMKALQAERESQQVTQREMAKAIGVSKNHLSAMERGVVQCRAMVLVRYAKTLGVSLDVLAGIHVKD